MTDELVSEASQLNKQLVVNSQGILQRSGPHFSKTLPGQPRVKLEQPELWNHLRGALVVPDLDALAGILWLVSTPRSSHISPLHHQAARGRKDIIIVENPQLHLVWSYDRIFVKPIPLYLLSHAFWQHLKSRQPDVYRAAVGFVRSYSYLVQHESDFRLASDTLCLIPADDGDGNPITFERFAAFIANFAHVKDADVSPRYEFGELRLTRLNIYTKLLFRNLTFHHIDAQWGSYVGHFITPLLSTFIIVTLPLSAMQVELTAQSLNNLSGASSRFAAISKYFSISVLIVFAVVVTFFAALVVFLFVHDIWFARSVMRRKRAGRDSLTTFKSGVI